jgi:4-methyl-5(b-hydroxyethyl)-thiazole monophosphate biosynthesis
MPVLIPLADGVEPLEAVTIIDVLRRASIRVTTASLTDHITIHAAHGIKLAADTTWSALNLEEFDALVLPGGGKGTEVLKHDERVLHAVHQFAITDRHVCAICAAPTVLAKAGVLEGRTATCYPSCAEELGDAYANAPVIADGNIITGQGPGTALLFSLVLVQHFKGDLEAKKVADALLTTIQ